MSYELDNYLAFIIKLQLQMCSHLTNFMFKSLQLLSYFSFMYLYHQTDVDNDAIHVITVANPVTTEKPPEYDTVVILDPPCYDDAIKLNPANLLKTKQYQDVSLPKYDDLEISEPYMPNQNQDNVNAEQQQTLQHHWTTSSTTNYNNINDNSNQTNESQNVTNNCSDNAFTVITIVQTAPNSSNEQQHPHQQHSITRKSNDCDSVASESIAMS